MSTPIRIRFPPALASDNHVRGVGSIFFGFWLIPMGWLVIHSRWMPRALGWILIAGGCGYVLSAFVGYLVPDRQAIADALVILATVGELWMVGYLLVRGVNRRASGGDDLARADT